MMRTTHRGFVFIRSHRIDGHPIAVPWRGIAAARSGAWSVRHRVEQGNAQRARGSKIDAMVARHYLAGAGAIAPPIRAVSPGVTNPVSARVQPLSIDCPWRMCCRGRALCSSPIGRALIETAFRS